MNVKCEIKDKILYVSLTGEIDHHSAVGIRNEIDREIYKRAPKCVILELSGVDFMDSSGLGLILGRYSKLSALGADLKIADPSPKTEEILRLAGIDRMIPIEKGVKRV